MGIPICCNKEKPESKNEYMDGLLQEDLPMSFDVNFSNLKGKGLNRVVFIYFRVTRN